MDQTRAKTLAQFINANTGKSMYLMEIAERSELKRATVQNYLNHLSRKKPEATTLEWEMLERKNNHGIVTMVAQKKITFNVKGIKAADFQNMKYIKKITEKKIQTRLSSPIEALLRREVVENMKVIMDQLHTGLGFAESMKQIAEVQTQILEDILDILANPQKGPEEKETAREGATT